MNRRFVLLLAVAIALGCAAGTLLYRSYDRDDWKSLCTERAALATPGTVIRVSTDHGDTWHVCAVREGVE